MLWRSRTGEDRTEDNLSAWLRCLSLDGDAGRDAARRLYPSQRRADERRKAGGSVRCSSGEASTAAIRVGQCRVLRIEDDQFANTPEADLYLVRGRSTYLGGAHELYSDLWSAALAAGQSIRAGAPTKSTTSQQCRMPTSPPSFAASIRRRWRPAASWLQVRFHRSPTSYGCRRRLGGLAIAACQNCPDLRATVFELPRVAEIARSFIEEAGMTDRVQVRAADVLACAPEGRFDVAALRNLIQVLGLMRRRARCTMLARQWSRAACLSSLATSCRTAGSNLPRLSELTSSSSAFMTRARPIPGARAPQLARRSRFRRHRSSIRRRAGWNEHRAGAKN